MRTVLLLLVALSANAADLRDIKDPAKILPAAPAAAKIRLVNVWATWCVPCVAELPELRSVDEAFGHEVAILGVSTDHMIPETTRQQVIGFLDKKKVSYINLYYSGNADALADFLNFDGEIPVTIAFDRKGKELWRKQGPIDAKETIAELKKLLRRMQ